MANEKLTDLSELAAAPAADDWFYVVDKSDTTDDAAGSSKKISITNAMASVYTFTTPGTVTINEGSSADTVSDVQTFSDGNAYNLSETGAATPGFDVEFDFNVSDFRGLVCMAYYSPANSTHYATLDVYNHNSTSWDTFLKFTPQEDYNIRTVLIPDGSNYISSGDLDIRFYHPDTGNASHDMYISYLAILE